MHRKPILLCLSLLLALAAAGWPASAPAARWTRTSVITSRTDGGLRVVLTAKRQGHRDAATVFVSAYEKAGAGWRLGGTKVVARRGVFSWSALARPNAARFLSVSGKDRSATFQILLSPVVGWSNTYLFRLQRGRLVGGVMACGCAPQN